MGPQAFGHNQLSAAAKVTERGAEPVRGDLDDRTAMRTGAQGCEFGPGGERLPR